MMLKFILGNVVGVIIGLSALLAQEDDPALWPESDDAVVAAPQNHEVLYEDADLRLLSVTIDAAELEPMHHHRWPSVIMITQLPAGIDHAPDGSKVEYDALGPDAPIPMVIPTGPQPTHAWQNLGDTPAHLYRLEFKKLEFRNLQSVGEQLD